MPFQGNPNAGQPDPALLNLLFQQKARREEMAYKQQQDALAAQRQAQLDAAEEARKDAEHRMKLAKDTFEMMNKAREQEAAIGSTQENNRQAKSEIAQAYPFVSTPGTAVQGPSGGMATEYGALPDQSIQNAYTQQQFGQQLDEPLNARIAALASVLKGISPEMQQYAKSLPGQGMQAEMSRGRLLEEEAAKSQFEFDRQATKEDQARAEEQRNALELKRVENQNAINRPTEIIKTREKELQKLSNQIADPKITGQARELAESQYRAIRAEADADLTRSQAPEVVMENRRRANENFEYDQVYDQSRSVTELIRRLESGDTKSIGVEAWASEVLGNFKNIVQTTSSVPFMDRYSASLDSVLNNPANTTEEKQKIIDTYFSQENLDRVASGQLTEQEMQWWFMYSLNPDGRVSNMLAKDTQNNVQIIGPLVGPKLALSRLRAMANRQGQFLRRRRSYISKVDKSEAFDPTDGRRVASESLPMPTTAGPTAPAGAVPRMTPAERARAISGAGAP